jgi:hypothetical protein
MTALTRRLLAEPCERCNGSGKVYLASFVTPLNLAPWDEGPEMGPCPDCALPCPTVGRDGNTHHTPHDVSADVDRRTP